MHSRLTIDVHYDSAEAQPSLSAQARALDRAADHLASEGMLCAEATSCSSWNASVSFPVKKGGGRARQARRMRRCARRSI